MKKIIIFTDLDGTLLDSTYSFEAALPALKLLKEKNIPTVICSSKTRKEIEHYRKKLGNNHPFISENGGGIFIPKGYFRFEIADCGFMLEKTEDYFKIIRLGVSYEDLRNAIKELQKEGFNIRGFGDMTVKELVEIANLSIDEAEMAKERDFDEPFIFDGNEEELNTLFDSITAKGFNYTQGRFFHILGNSDKGKAVSILVELYKKEFGEVVTIAIGDSPNDVPMLEKVDYPIIVKRHDGIYDSRINIKNIIRAEGIGPNGWNKAVVKIIKT